MDAQKLALENRILEVRVGSHLFGTQTPESDEDFTGIFMPSKEVLFGLERIDECKFDITSKDEGGRNTAEAVDRTLHEYRRFCRLALQNNPNILHTLFTNEENIVYLDPIGFGRRLLNMREVFLHKGLFDRFIGYASAQKHKMLIKPENHKALLEALEVLERLEDNKVLVEIENFPGTRTEDSKYIKIGDLTLNSSCYIKKARRMVKDRLDKASVRTQYFTKYGYDLKFSSNLIQLLMEGVEILKSSSLKFPLSYATDILDIKAGKYTAQEILDWAVEIENNCREALKHTSLPDKPRYDEIQDFVVREVSSYSVCKAQEAIQEIEQIRRLYG